jgi:hypothetical protein
MPVVQSGGFAVVNMVQRMMDQFDSPLQTTYGIVMILLIVYSSVIPASVISYADSTLGRIIGLGVIYATTTRLSWIYGLLASLAFLVLLRSSVTRAQEGFYGGPVTEKPRIGKRWFVEKVLGEDPLMIATEKVVTQPVQD